MAKLIEKKITLGRDQNGKLVRKSIYGKKKSEIEKKVFAARQEWLLTAPKIEGDKICMLTFARRWRASEKAHAASNTKAMYDNVIEKHLAPELEDLFFDEIEQADLQRIIDRNFQKYETCNKIRLTLRQIYAAAADAGIAINPTVNTKRLVIPPKPRNEKRALTEEEKQAVLSADLGDKQRAFVYTLYYTGLRREEVLALESADLDFKTNQLHVSKAVVFERNDAVVSRTKNTYSIRSVPIPDVAVPFLKQYAAGKRLLFPMATDPARVMTLSSFAKFWYGIQRALARKAPTAIKLTPHIFRHNYATMLYYSDISMKKAAQLMGHKDTTMIMNIYAHLDEEKENAVEKINAVFK